MKNMAKNGLILIYAVAFFVCSAAISETILSWDFENYKNHQEVSVRSDKFDIADGTKGLFHGKIVPRSGVNNSVGLSCVQDAAFFSGLPLDGKEFTLEMRFKLIQKPDNQNHSTLFAYSADKGFRRQMIAWILPNGQIEVNLEILNENKKAQKRFSFISPPREWQTEKYYSLRFSCISGGTAELELDGEIIATSEDNAMCPGDLRILGEKGHSMLYFGYYPFYGPRLKQVAVLQGYVDDIKVYDKALLKTAGGKVARTKDSLTAKRQEMPHLCLDNQWSPPFLVADQPGQLLGTFQRAEEKYWQNAARIRAVVKESELVVEYDCPVPDGMKTECKPGFFWRSDRVELFLQPNPTASKYYQYALNAQGETYAGIGMAKNKDSKAKFSVTNSDKGFSATITIPLDELGLADMKPGYMLKGNFMRGGPTAGGASFWAPTGAEWHAIENFAPILFGTRQAYFQQKLANVQKEISDIDGAMPKIQENLNELEEMIATQGDKGESFNRLEQSFEEMNYSLVQLRFANRRQLIWQPQVWENHLNITSLATPLKTIKVRMPRNARRMVGFAVSNLEENAFLGQVKVFNRWPYPDRRKQLFGEQEWNDFLSGITFHEGLPVFDVNGKLIYDPIAPLPMNTVLRIPPRATAPVWMEVSSHGLEPGQYTGQLVLKNCDGNGGVETVMLEVTVSPTDIAFFHLDNAQGNSVMQRAWQHKRFRDFFLKYNYNYLYIRPRMYLTYDSQSQKWTVTESMRQLDQLIELAIQSGFDPGNLKLCFYLCWEHGFAGKPDTPAWENRIRASIPYWLEYLEKRYGITNDRVVLWPIDEPQGRIDDPKSSMSQALRWCKLLREIAPKAKITVNPLYAGKTDVFEKLAPYCDIMYCYRPELDSLPDFTARIKKLNKEVWTYNILYKQTKPEIYRRDYWKNCRDGFQITKFWDFDSCSGGDCFDSSDVTNAESKQIYTRDCAMAYVDFNYGTMLTSRRMEAAARGFDETRVAWFCRSLLEKLERMGENVQELKAELDSAIRQGADGSMSVMDAQADKILALSEKIIPLYEAKNGTPVKKEKTQ